MYSSANILKPPIVHVNSVNNNTLKIKDISVFKKQISKTKPLLGLPWWRSG